MKYRLFRLINFLEICLEFLEKFVSYIGYYMFMLEANCCFFLFQVFDTTCSLCEEEKSQLYFCKIKLYKTFGCFRLIHIRANEYSNCKYFGMTNHAISLHLVAVVVIVLETTEKKMWFEHIRTTHTFLWNSAIYLHFTLLYSMYPKAK